MNYVYVNFVNDRLVSRLMKIEYPFCYFYYKYSNTFA